MSLADRGAPYPSASTPVYTVYAGEGSTNYGFHACQIQSQEPPPKYEDVVSGEYLKWNPMNHGETPTSTPLPAPPESEPSRQENEKEKSRKAVGTFLFALILILIFIWRISAM